MTMLPWRGSRAAGPASRRTVVACLGALIGWLAAAQAPAAAAGATVSNAWMRLVLPSRPAAGYLTLSNPTDQPLVLVGAASPACGSLMLHRSVRENGQDRMEMVMTIAVPAHADITFAPGGYHLMCMRPSKDVAPGGSVPVTLRFEDGATVTASFEVRGAAGK